jgi:hypothetical protein
VTVFADLDETIRQLLVRYVPLDPNEVEITFAIPDREWSGRLTRPTINCFLYDLRENLRLRNVGWDVRRDMTNNTATRQRGPLRIDASYQITAWARAPEDEHRLLWRVLAALFRHSPLPADLLVGGLRDQPMPIPTSVVQPDQMPQNFADLWQGLDNRIRPALTYVATLALDPEVAFTRPLVLRDPEMGVRPLTPEEVRLSARMVGRVRDQQDPARGVAGALVLLQETGERAVTDEQGQFVLYNVPRGPVTVVLRATGKSERVIALTVPAPSYDFDL